MKSDIQIPSMGESISQAKIGALLVKPGSQVKRDQELLELETDKVNQVLYAPAEGIFQLTVKQGDTVDIGQTIGYIDSEGKAESSPPKVSKPEIKDEAPPKKAIEQPEVKKVEPAQIPTEPNSKETRKKFSQIRKVIAQRMVEAQHTTATLTTFNEIDMSQVILLREKYQEAFQKKHQVKLGFMPFFVEAVVSALKTIPVANAFIDGDEIVYRNSYNIGIAVGTDKGLFVPVIKNCDRLTFPQIEISLDTLAKKAREGRINMDDLLGGSFTITNGGVYGSLLSTPILNPPQSAILGMHKIQKRVVVVDDQMVIRPMMYVALSYDHRLIDGKEAILFLVHIKNMLEDPSRLLLDI